MTGPEHYREAEQLLATITRITEPEDTANPRFLAAVQADMARAQVHATLALAAATALASHDEADSPDHQEWHAAASLTDPEEMP